MQQTPNKIKNYILFKILQLRRRHKTTSWNAWTKFTKTKEYSKLVKMLYKNRVEPNRTYHIKRMLHDPEVQNQFFKDNITKKIKGKSREGIMGLVLTPKNQFIRRKK